MIGTRIGRYELLRPLATGGMGEVYLAREETSDAGFGSLVAIKVLLQHLSSNQAFVRMFLDEARTVAKLRHEHIVQIRDIAQQAGQYYMVMEYIRGQNLRELLGDASIPDRSLFSPRLGAQLFADLANALSVVHRQGQVHRDLSPNNIMISDAGVPKLIDFGVARALGNASLTTPGTLKGKFGYMAPEYIKSQSYDHRVDLFSLGVVMWETFARRRLFEGTNTADQMYRVLDGEIPRLDALLTGFPMSLADLVACALQRDPERRIPTASALADALAEISRAQPPDGDDRNLRTWLERRLAPQIEERRRADQELLALPPGAVLIPPGVTSGSEDLEVSVASTPVPTTVHSGSSLRLSNGELVPATARELPHRIKRTVVILTVVALVLGSVALVALTRGAGEPRSEHAETATPPPSPPPAASRPMPSTSETHRQLGLDAMAAQDYAKAISEFAQAMRGGASSDLVELIELARRLQRDQRAKPVPAPMATAPAPVEPGEIPRASREHTVQRSASPRSTAPALPGRSATTPAPRAEPLAVVEGERVPPVEELVVRSMEPEVVDVEHDRAPATPPAPARAPILAPPPPPPPVAAPRRTPRVTSDGDAAAGARVVAQCNACHASQSASPISGPRYSRAQWERFFATGQHDRHGAIGDHVSATELKAARAFLRARAYDAAEHQGAGIRER